MPRVIAYDAVPELGAVLPADLYRMRIESIRTDDHTQAGVDMITAVMRVVAGNNTKDEQKDSPFYERFTLGTPDDPTGEDPETQKRVIGFRMWKRFLVACGVPLNSQEVIEDTAARCVDKELYYGLTETENDGKRDPSRKGLPENKVTGVWALGDNDARRGIPKATAKATPRRTTPAAAAPARAAAPAPAAAAATNSGNDLGGGFSFEDE